MRDFRHLVLALWSLAFFAAPPPSPCEGFPEWAALSAAAALPAADAAACIAAVAARERAIVEKDKALFMGTLAPGDPEFLLEQSRWFDYRMGAEIRDYSLAAESIRAAGKGEYDLVLRQSYSLGPDRAPRDLRYIEKYRLTSDGARDADLAFASFETEHFSVKCAIPPEDPPAAAAIRASRAVKASRDAESAWSIVARGWGSAPAGKTVVKLFPDQELLRQNSKITIGRLFNGWGEEGESIKLFLRPDPSRSYVAVIAHELMHKVTLAKAGKLCSWFAEGLANEYGSFAAMGGNYLDGGFHQAADYDRGIAWLESLEPELIDDDSLWWIYGGMAGAVIRFIAETWGAEALAALLSALAASPQREGGYVYALHDAALRAKLHAAIGDVLGLGMEEFEGRWRVWIERKRGPPRGR